VDKKIYQIYYDASSMAGLDPGLIPLDNSHSQRPDWFEFYPILNYINQIQLKDDVWYGFLSPKFKNKTGYTSTFIKDVLDKNASAEVALFSHSWDQIAYFKNPWEQGEFFHPGLTLEAQKFLDHIDFKINLTELVSTNGSTVYSNFVIAKRKYWEEWRVLANQLFDYAESYPLSKGLHKRTKYGVQDKRYEMKVFLQERLPTLILEKNKFKTLITDNSKITPIFERIFKKNEKNIQLIKMCGDLKNMHRSTGDKNLLDAYFQIRKNVELNS
jgi:hypothetical protein